MLLEGPGGASIYIPGRFDDIRLTPTGLDAAAISQVARAGLVLIMLGLVCYLLFRVQEVLFLLMLTVVVSDSAQYYSGRALGRRLLAPTISPM